MVTPYDATGSALLAVLALLGVVLANVMIVLLLFGYGRHMARFLLGGLLVAHSIAGYFSRGRRA